MTMKTRLDETVAALAVVRRGPPVRLRRGATETQILEVEAALGHRLPPSYRAFLACTDGWDESKFFSCKELLRAAKKAERVLPISAKLKRPESMFVLRPPKGTSKPGAEWPLAFRYPPRERRYKSFGAYLEQLRTYAVQRAAKIGPIKVRAKRPKAIAKPKPNPKVERVSQRVLERGVAARNAYFTDEGDPRSALRRGASESQIAHLERTLDARLPSSYRRFLMLSNGWDFFDANVSLLTAKQVADAHAQGTFAKWYRDMQFEELGYPPRTVVIGTSDISSAKYVLVVPKNESKEWKVLFVDKDGDRTHASFGELLSRSERTYAALGK